MKSILFLFVVSVLLVSCGHFHDDPNTSVWAEQLWLAFWLPFLGGLAFLVVAYFASKSNSTKQLRGSTLNNTGNVPIYKLWKFRFGVFLIVVSFIVVWYVNSPNWR